MKSIWLFRSNLRILEDYHDCNTVYEFTDRCWDFYLLQGLQLLNTGDIDEFIVWRLTPDGTSHLNVNSWILDNGGRFEQRFVNNFEEIFNPVFDYDKHLPDISLHRGGFPEYDALTKNHADKLGLKLYLAAGQRTTPQYGGVYDNILYEEELETKASNFIPFYKTANPRIFKPILSDLKYDICFPANFTQLRYKNQERFIAQK